jgi:hypothetical protein
MEYPKILYLTYSGIMACAPASIATGYTLKMILAVSGRVAGGTTMKYGAKIAPTVMQLLATAAVNNARLIVFIRTITGLASAIDAPKLAIPCAETAIRG